MRILQQKDLAYISGGVDFATYAFVMTMGFSVISGLIGYIIGYEHCKSDHDLEN